MSNPEGFSEKENQRVFVGIRTYSTLPPPFSLCAVLTSSRYDFAQAEECVEPLTLFCNGGNLRVPVKKEHWSVDLARQLDC